MISSGKREELEEVDNGRKSGRERRKRSYLNMLFGGWSDVVE
jgi:hypothetical protein